MTTPASRDDHVTTVTATTGGTATTPGRPACPACGQPVDRPQGRQAYCSHACRQRAYRHRQPQPDPLPTAPVNRTTGRAVPIVYQCPDCDTHYLGQQRCPDCNTFCTRIGPGGHCTHCQEVIIIDDVLHP